MFIYATDAPFIRDKLLKTVDTVCKDNNIRGQSAQFAVLEDKNIRESRDFNLLLFKQLISTTMVM
jgi:hypothetical protein